MIRTRWYRGRWREGQPAVFLVRKDSGRAEHSKAYGSCTSNEIRNGATTLVIIGR
jgi:hypothetical protein